MNQALSSIFVIASGTVLYSTRLHNDGRYASKGGQACDQKLPKKQLLALFPPQRQ